jgi:SAM-dependent methyltransferase
LNNWLGDVRVLALSERESYRQAFVDNDEVEHYETLVYRAGSYDSWIWRMQSDYLAALLDRRFPDGIDRYLDFACGSGRVLALIAPRAAHPVGVDVSRQMLAVARERVPAATLEQRDITRDSEGGTRDSAGATPDSEGAERFDLVTAFRFFLNAEPALRRDALRALHDRLKDDGVLIVNLHGNPWSMRAVGATVRRLVLREPINHLSLRAFTRLLGETGFEVQEWHGFGLMVARVFNTFGPRLPEAAEALARRFPVLQHACVDLVVVCRRR